MTDRAERRAPPWSSIAGIALLVVPWVNPFAGGPSPSVEPWLVSFVCGLLLAALAPRGALQWRVVAGLAAFAGFALLRTGATLDSMALAGGCALLVVAAGVGAQWVREGAWPDLATALVVAAAASTAMALLQYFSAADAFVPWVSASASGEAYANLRQRNQFACLAVLGVAAVLWHPRLAARPVVAFPLLAWLAMGNAATTSRTGLLQLVVVCALAGWWLRPRGRTTLGLVLVPLLAYAAAAVLLPSLSASLGGAERTMLWERVAETASCSSRRVLWSNVLELVRERPLAGWGWGDLDFAHFMHLYDGPRFCDILDNAHNLPLHVAVELGVPALLILAAWALWLVAGARPWAETAPARQFAWAVVLLVGLHSGLEYPLWYGPFQLTVGACLGLLWPRRVGAGGAPAAADPKPLAWQALVIVLFGVATVYASWDYRRVSQIYLPAEERAASWRTNTEDHVARSWLFAAQAQFALLTLAPLTRENAAWTLEMGERLLHYSPEPRIIEKVIESATMLERYDEAVLYLARFRAAFPDAYTEWSARHRLRKPAPG